MTSLDYEKLAMELLNAEHEKREMVRLTIQYPNMTVEEAYAIQEQLVAMKQADGYRIIGPKMGLTSAAKMAQMGVNEPIYGYVFDYMIVPNGGTVAMNELIHPKVEAEIAFILKEDVQGPDIDATDILAATEYIIPALEIIDSRYANFEFALPDVIADNASSSRVVFGNRLVPPVSLELDLLGVSLSINGEGKAFGAGAAVLGHPANAIAMLANMLSRKGKGLKAGEIILAGAMTEAVRFVAGDVVFAQFDQLGTVSFRSTD
ncbi:4-oxalocrotonate decarboxylase [Geobacillus sp. GHH01]|uniref:4-oxalocrotonate decarboxylase n=1 Tax=Geobacillus zalihae TaxID=213419 RepID=A0A7H1RWT5_9BACL|nr:MULTISPECIES: fumarylacetoacetate hydrolase family protein [Geobacillus]AGE22016.1 4-oxalocrotonate decarboxylase [Geobacillus sp. GHH01]EPR30186.1 4-oxalocrotonate decarboxylase [Geobacillus sp. WSUCF1]OQP22093.1 4-oxalocrotonate decarboxylase [Geobacillus zalihae]QNU18724.1 4-oxalocrotonate decarboxylase [Geobacillus zalihae]